MSLFSRARKPASSAAEPKVCNHPDLAPRWDSAAAMGKPELITYYQCCTCGARVDKADAKLAS